MPNYGTYDLRSLCPVCWERPVAPGADRCQMCILRVEHLRNVAVKDQEQAAAVDSETNWGADAGYGGRS